MAHPYRADHDAREGKARRYAEPQMERVDRTHDVPYLAGSSNKGGTTYIDRRVPTRIKTANGRTYDPAHPLVVHEQTEHRLMEEGMEYKPAHKRATEAELSWFERKGYTRRDFVKYDREMTQVATHVTELEDVKNPPKDLYLKPYSARRQKAIRAAEHGRKSNAPLRSGS